MELGVILVDTSVWVGYLRGTASPSVETLDGLFRADSEVVITEPVLMELLAGARHPRDRAIVEALVNGLPLIAIEPAEDFRNAADLYAASTINGHPIRSQMDCLIAAVAIRRGIPLLHQARDFEYLAEISPLRLYSPA